VLATMGPGSRRRRWKALAIGLLAYMFSATPAAASFIYCVGTDGHAGFELVGGVQTGCSNCCHRPTGTGEHGEPRTEECVDISMADHEPTIAKKHDASGSADLFLIAPVLAAWPADLRCAHSRTAAQSPPPPSLPFPSLRRLIVLQI